MDMDNFCLPTNMGNSCLQSRIKYFKSHLINMAELCMHFMLKAKFPFLKK